MRCNNCGWSNEPNAKRCEKCNAPLNGSMIGSVDDSEEKEVHEAEHEADILKDTLREVPDNDGGTSCPRCGYNVAPYMQVCPICQTPVNSKGKDINKPQGESSNVHNNTRGTINPWAKGMYQHDAYFCQLQPVAWEGESIEYQPLSYSGEQIVLNRANTDPNNQTITSKEQAILTHENGCWFIENQSEHKSTYIQVNRKMKLNDGDIIVMGNRYFVFHEK